MTYEVDEFGPQTWNIVRITRKIGHFLPKDWPPKKKLVNPLCKAIHTVRWRQG